MDRFIECGPQYFDSIRRCARWRDDGPAEGLRGQNNFGDPAARFGHFLSLENFVDGGGIRNLRVSLIAREKEHSDEIFLLPGEERLAAEEWRSGHAAANDFSPFHRKVDLGSTRVAQNRLNF